MNLPKTIVLIDDDVDDWPVGTNVPGGICLICELCNIQTGACNNMRKFLH